MKYFRIIFAFMRASFQEEAAYRVNFVVHLFYALLNLGSGVLALVILFETVQTIQGWDLPSTLALLGVYQTVNAVRDLFIGPSFDSLAGIEGDIWTGRFDFTVIRPLNIQFMASLRKWRLFTLTDLGLGLGVLGMAVLQLKMALSGWQILVFLLALTSALLVLYAILLAFTALIFWSPGVLFTWIFNGFFQMGRYPVDIYPGWLKWVMTWVIPVAFITTVPARALTGQLSIRELLVSLALGLVLTVGASLLFKAGLKRYASASS